MGEAERVTSEGLAELARGLPDADIAEVADFIGYLKTKRARELPMILRDAPPEDEELSFEEEAAIAESKAEIAAGLELISMEKMKAELGL